MYVTAADTALTTLIRSPGNKAVADVSSKVVLQKIV